jgi:hypothetical protein
MTWDTNKIAKYLGNLDFKVWILCGLQILFIGSSTMRQKNSWLNLISLLLLFIELGKVLLGVYVICVIDCTVIKSAVVHTTYSGKP